MSKIMFIYSNSQIVDQDSQTQNEKKITIIH